MDFILWRFWFLIFAQIWKFFLEINLNLFTFYNTKKFFFRLFDVLLNFPEIMDVMTQ